MEKLPTSFKALRYLPFLVASAFFMQMLDATILNTAIPTIARSFNSPCRLHSLVTAYTLTVCVLIPASGWISDKLGSRRTFLLAISVFSAGSLLCALSTSIPMMTACRVIQGIGGAFLMPVGRLVVLRSYPRSMFVNVLNIVTIPAPLGPLLGPVLAASSSSTPPGTGSSDQHSGGHRRPVGHLN
ncbi:MAG: MFS transporter [Akkermansia sp.]